MASIEEIAAALHSIAKPGMKPKALRDAIKEKFPDASKKDIVRAAFHAVTDPATADQPAIPDLHNFALSERHGDEETAGDVKLRKLKKKKRAA